MESSECLVIAQGKAKCPPFPRPPLTASGGSERPPASLPALLPPPRSLAASFSSAVPAFPLTPGVHPCPQRGEKRRQKGEKESPGFRGARSWSPRACGGSDDPLPFPSPCAAEALDAAVLLPCAAAAATAARSLVERVSGCKLRQTSLHPPPGKDTQ